ncbi:hypothetical protein D3877_29185 [Azospirillum cavernae]|uniref:Uncharacterized protein n=1 Tax=Azospirillum cavernae TaxID=2320860 RepID=A0A418VK27_9PROT|nr:hypothetical protein D3877_29185 [Azospirillum cavernae]
MVEWLPAKPTPMTLSIATGEGKGGVNPPFPRSEPVPVHRAAPGREDDIVIDTGESPMDGVAVGVPASGVVDAPEPCGTAALAGPGFAVEGSEQVANDQTFIDGNGIMAEPTTSDSPAILDVALPVRLVLAALPRQEIPVDLMPTLDEVALATQGSGH